MASPSSVSAAAPITPNWKISEVLQVHPELLDVLIETAPEFKKLRNPILRRVQSKLVTVGQAAQIAGLEPAYLVDRLNAAAGIQGPVADKSEDSSSSIPKPEPPWVDAATIAQWIDVRPYQQRGEEPFSAIMAAIREVPRGQVLLLRNTFEPTPLYDILGQRGFEHWATQLGESDWEIRFFHAGSARTSQQPANAPDTARAHDTWDDPTSTLTIDVSELVPPEPMIRILTALEELPDGASLLVHHVRRPMHLYPRLDELGYHHDTREIGPAQVEILIEKPAAPVPVIGAR
ncbi:MAG TPA: DUF2249 domain-containing protein [Thermomicrobiales bacterium]|nr:DUF2249 domain-containing protein [Thermomicrobiales bacterium]